MLDSLFERLDLNKDGELSRSELHTAALRMGWHWHDAPLLALFDLLTIPKPIPKHLFSTYMQEIAQDPLGPYGSVLLHSPHFSSASPSSRYSHSIQKRKKHDAVLKNQQSGSGETHGDVNLVSALERTAGPDIANTYLALVNTLEPSRLSAGEAALLIIDPQQSFTKGVWMQSIGPEATADVEPIVMAFNNCAECLRKIYGRMEVMFTRCPFPPWSYDWNDRLVGILDSSQLYFIKPGNSVLFPPFNGFKEWVDFCIDCGKRTLVMGGCTLNSCVRVSSIETRAHFKVRNLQIVVDLSLSGARMRNFIPSTLYGGLSAVESAIRQMKAAGVRVVPHVEWQ